MKGHVRERGKGNWYAVLSVRDAQTGKRRVKFISLSGAADLVKPPKVERKEMQTIDTNRTIEVIEAARGSRMLIPTLLGVLCGLRRGEVVALRWRSVDLDAGQLSVVASAEQTDQGVREKETKSGKGRAVTLSPTLMSELRRYRAEQAQMLLKLGVRLADDYHVVTREDGVPIQPRSLSRAFRKFMRRHRLPQIRLHDLRHSHATHLPRPVCTQRSPKSDSDIRASALRSICSVTYCRGCRRTRLPKLTRRYRPQ
jgi:integrase